MATPTITVTDVPAIGGAVTVTGSGFATTGVGIYLGVGDRGQADFYAANTAKKLIDAQTQWVAPEGNTGSNATIAADGTFSVVITVPANNSVRSFSVYTSKAHGTGVGDKSENTVTPLPYADAIPAAGAPTLTISKVPEGGGDVIVSGTGFLGTTPGIYLGLGTQGESGFYSANTNKALVESETTWIAVGNDDADTSIGRTAPMTTKGAFSVTITVPAGTSTSYAIYTSRAHGVGVTDLSQNVTKRLSYADAPTVPTPTITVSKVAYATGKVTIKGKNFAVQAPGVYLGLGTAGFSDFYAANSAKALVADQTILIAAETSTVTRALDVTASATRTAVLAADGTFTVTVTVPANGKKYAIYTSLASGVGATDPSQNASALLVRAAAPAGSGGGTGGGSTTDRSGTTTAAASPTEEVEPVCVARAVSGAQLKWAIKDSFRSYISGSIANGSWSLSGVGDAGGRFVFSNGTGSYNTDADKGIINFPGTIHFTGHDGALDITITNVAVRYTTATSGTVVASFKTLGLDGKRITANNIAFANISLKGGSEGAVTDASTTLTAGGAKAFGGFYDAGQALAALTVTAPLGAEVACDVSTVSALATTGPADASGAFLVALLLVLAGTGARIVFRRRPRAGSVATVATPDVRA